MTILILLPWIAIAALTTYGVYAYWRYVEMKFDSPDGEDVAVIIPIKGAAGHEAHYDSLITTCLAQRQVSCRLIFAVESAADPAAGPIARIAGGDSRVTLVIAGPASGRSQKVHNQLAALSTLTPRDRYVVFADSDVSPAPDWLSQLLRPILWGTAELTSGYRWILPADDRLASRFCALMDWGVATAPRSRRWNVCWGGSVAVARATLDRLDLARVWAGVLSDDFALTRAARAAGIRIFAAHQVLAPSPVRHDLASMIAFGRRQYMITRIHSPRYWWLAGVTLAFPALCGVFAIIVALRGDIAAIVWIAIAFCLQQLRAWLRVDIARRVLPAEEAAISAALLKRDWWKLPAVGPAHLAIWLASAFGRTITWAGIRYRMLEPDRIEILGS
jgi:cellulose synthase/poly-beta-1,6-N-acetylglucosamine synthase-like glycosyltransferase